MEYNRGDIIEVRITDMSSEGKGVGKIEGSLVVFIEDALIGDVVSAEIIKKKKNFCEAKLLETIEYSKLRTLGACELADKCGGCQLQGLNYESQLNIKQNKVENAFKNITDIEVKRIKYSEKPHNYRNKTTLHVRKNKKEINIGYYEKNSHDIVDMKDCQINSSISEKIIPAVRKWIKDEEIKGIRHIIIRNSETTGEIMLVLVTKNKKLIDSEELIQYLKNEGVKITTIVQNINSEKTNLVLGKESKILFGNGFIIDVIDGIKFKIREETFYQINSFLTESLYNTILEKVNPSKEEIVVDAYSGVGTITSLLSKNIKKGYGIESNSQSIESAVENTELNSIGNIEYLEGKVENILPELYEKEKNIDTIILDPPRKGCEKKVIDTILEIEPKKIVYVSCDPYTLSRDIKLLLEDKKYGIVEIQPFDLFPETVHVESVVLIERKTM